MGSTYAVFRLLDPDTEKVLWVGCGRTDRWKLQAMRPVGTYKSAVIRELRQRGRHPVPDLIGYFRTWAAASVAKALAWHDADLPTLPMVVAPTPPPEYDLNAPPPHDDLEDEDDGLDLAGLERAARERGWTP